MNQPLQNRLLIFLLAIVGGLLATFSHADHEKVKLQVLAQIRNPDLASYDSEGKISIDNRASRLIEAVLEEAGIDYEYRLFPWARILQELSAHKNIIAYPIARTADRESEMRWLGQIRPVNIYLYGLRAKSAQLPASLEEARNTAIGVIREDVADDYLTKEGLTELVRVNDLANAITMLERGRFELFPFEAHGVDEMLRLNNLPSNYLVPVVKLDSISTDLYFSMSNHTDDHVRELLQSAYQRLAEDGTYKEIMGFEQQNSSGC